MTPSIITNKLVLSLTPGPSRVAVAFDPLTDLDMVKASKAMEIRARIGGGFPAKGKLKLSGHYYTKGSVLGF
ncbi:hypothetical protein N7497_003742 [Penicillium chrysogenum]|jgi:hypothetical protein|uniref:Uncharacterized protein n=1 Tax=Penicillium chrysogenum TaxID=5076 RepID=A0ABQ8WXU5_PENCH|nr:hypothetical protein N7505_001439 [Penicillium chrysogenum]KAJ6163763.1 hypothetical protein N7497_003742 [Penicillium chrysogenum]